DSLLSQLDPHDLATMGRLNRLINSEVRSYFRRTFSVNRVLSPFVKDCDGFRAIQARTGTLVSGSTALQFFKRTVYTGADLDLYVPQHHTLDVATFLCDHEGYTFSPSEAQGRTVKMAMNGLGARRVNDSYIGQGIAGVLDFSRDEKRVQIIVSKRSPIDIILHFHSTAVMNILTHSTAYSLFPRLTFHKKLSRVLASSSSAAKPGPQWTAVRQKYIARGFSFVRILDEDEVRGSSARWIGDARTWTISVSPPLPHL
ncbi:hypothetical protein PENSPDRAFT_555480, partial [Peniophora sp. CONT]